MNDYIILSEDSLSEEGDEYEATEGQNFHWYKVPIMYWGLPWSYIMPRRRLVRSIKSKWRKL